MATLSGVRAQAASQKKPIALAIDVGRISAEDWTGSKVHNRHSK